MAVTPRAMIACWPRLSAGQRGLAARRGVFPLEHLLVVAARLEGLVVEVLDRLVVEQAVDGARVGGRVVFVDGAPDVDAPVADLDREHDVADQRDQGDEHEADVVLDEEDAEHQADFDQRRQDRIQRVGSGWRSSGCRARCRATRRRSGVRGESAATARAGGGRLPARPLAHGALRDAGEEISRSSVNRAVEKRSAP
jgi:hypothetical protein